MQNLQIYDIQPRECLNSFQTIVYLLLSFILSLLGQLVDAAEEKSATGGEPAGVLLPGNFQTTVVYSPFTLPSSPCPWCTLPLRDRFRWPPGKCTYSPKVVCTLCLQLVWEAVDLVTAMWCWFRCSNNSLTIFFADKVHVVQHTT